MLAARLGMSLQRCQRETTSTEFKEWCKFLADEWQVPTREDYYLAQIAAEVRRTIARNPQRVDTKDFLFKFRFQNKGRACVLTEEEKARRLAASKAQWFAFTGFKGRAKRER